MAEDDIFDFKDENIHLSNTQNISSLFSFLRPTSSKTGGKFTCNAASGRSDVVVPTKQGQRLQLPGSTYTYESAPTKSKRGGRPGAKFKLPKVPILIPETVQTEDPSNEILVSFKKSESIINNATSEPEIAIASLSLNHGPIKSIELHDATEPSALPDIQGPSGISDEQESLPSELLDDTDSLPDEPHDYLSSQKDDIFFETEDPVMRTLKTPVKIPTVDNEASIFRKMTTNLKLTQKIPFPRNESIQVISSAECKEHVELGLPPEAKTKEEAIRLLYKEMNRASAKDGPGNSCEGKMNANRLNAILYPDDDATYNLLSPKEHKKTVVQLELPEAMNHNEPGNNALRDALPQMKAFEIPLFTLDVESQTCVLASKIDIQDIHVDETGSRLTDISSMQSMQYIQGVAEAPLEDGQNHPDQDGSKSQLGQAGPSQAICDQNGLTNNRTFSLDAFPLLEPTVEELLEQSSIIESSILENKIPVEELVIVPATKATSQTPNEKAFLLDTPSTLTKSNTEEENPFLSPGLCKPSSNLLGRFISDADYWIYLLLVCCNQRRVIPFSTLIQEFTCNHLIKIGESSYSEVFLCKDNPPFVIKIIPVRTLLEENQDDYYQEHVYKDGTEVPYASRAIDVFNEVLMTKKLSPQAVQNKAAQSSVEATQLTTGFISCCSAYIVQGSYPSLLLDIWQNYNKKKKSENISPMTFPANQHYLVLMLSYGGNDLEKFKIHSFYQAFSIVNQLVISILYAQHNYEFEHRDLHGGNILIQTTTTSSLTMSLGSKIHDEDTTVQVDTHGVEIKIIDYTLSRMKPNLSSDKCLFSDLDSDPEIFKGDATVDFQYEMYRIMRQLIYECHTGSDSNTDTKASPWSNYCPKTNAAWIWFIMKHVISPKLDSLRKVAPLKKRFNILTTMLHDQVVRGENTLLQWYTNNQHLLK